MENLISWKPGVSKVWLYILAAVMWSGVGLYLNYLAYKWLRPVFLIPAIIIITCGLILAMGLYIVMFRGFADQNIIRIRSLTGDKICVFAFQKWTSYPLVMLMISTGIFLRLYSPIPKPFLAILYLAIGTGLLIASLKYYRLLVVLDDLDNAATSSKK
jgi:hypothetical protein